MKLLQLLATAILLILILHDDGHTKTNFQVTGWRTAERGGGGEQPKEEQGTQGNPDIMTGAVTGLHQL